MCQCVPCTYITCVYNSCATKICAGGAPGARSFCQPGGGAWRFICSALPRASCPHKTLLKHKQQPHSHNTTAQSQLNFNTDHNRQQRRKYCHLCCPQQTCLLLLYSLGSVETSWARRCLTPSPGTCVRQAERSVVLQLTAFSLFRSTQGRMPAAEWLHVLSWWTWSPRCVVVRSSRVARA